MTVRALRRGTTSGRGGGSGGPIASDTFDRADGALGTATVGGAWTAIMGTWAIASNRAKLTSTNSGAMAVAMLPVGTALSTGSALVDVQLSSGNARVGLVLRGTDQNSYMAVDMRSPANEVGIRKRLAATTTWVTAPITLVPGRGYTLGAILTATDVSAYVDGTLVATYTFTAQDNTDLPGQRVGFRTWDDVVDDEDGGSTYNDLLVTNVAALTPRVPALPLPPTAAAIDATSASIAWATPGNGGSALTSYTVTSSDPGHTYTGISPTATSFTATGLATGIAQTFTVTAINAVGSRVSAASNSVTPSGDTLTNGQQINITNVGRAGAAAAGVANYSGTLTTVSTAQNISTTQTIRNTRYTNQVDITGGTVVFEFCQFAFQPTSGGHALRIYNGGATTGTVTCNWCDFDSGLRGAQGAFETCGFQAGERGGGNPATTSLASSFTLYRCGVQGHGNGIGLHQWRASPSAITECYVTNLTSGGGSHIDAIECYSSDNITIQRCRLVPAEQSLINITPDFGMVPAPGNPLIIQNNYINGASGSTNSPVLTRWYHQGEGTPYESGWVRNVRYIGNYFGDANSWDAIADFNRMDVTYNAAYAIANPTVIYWSTDNVWAPNGEGVTSNTPGASITSTAFFAGESGAWNGTIVGPGGGATVPGPPTAVSAVAADAQATISFTAPGNDGGATIDLYRVTASPGGLSATGATSPIVLNSLTNGQPYTFTVAAHNSIGWSAESAASNSVTPAAGTAVGVVQYASGSTGSTVAPTTITPAFSAASTTGNTLLLIIGSDAIVATPSGWTLDQSQVNNDGHYVYHRTSAGQTSFAGVTIASASAWALLEISGTSTGTPDRVVSAGSSTESIAAFSTGTTAALSQASEICIASHVSSAAVNPAPTWSGYTNSYINPGINPVTTQTAGTNVGMAVATKLVNATTAQETSATPSALCAATAILVTYGTGVQTVTVPGAPTGVTASGGDTQASVSWISPSNGGAAIDSYRVTSTPATTTQTTAGTSLTFTGLTNGVSYTFTVAAHNSVGWGSNSSPSNSVTPAVATGFPDATSTGYLNAPSYPGSLSAGGAITSNNTYNFMQWGAFTAIGTSGTPVSNVTFNGCLFQGHYFNGVDDGGNLCRIFGSNITFNYCTWKPDQASPPVTIVNAYQFAIVADNVQKMTVSHCDFWGFGNAVTILGGSATNPWLFEHNWFHNACSDPIYHTDGIGQLNSGNTVSYCTINHNTIESIGTTNGLAFQEGHYNNFTVTNNLFGGFGYTVAIWGTNTSGGSIATNITFTDNTFSTRLAVDWGPLYHDTWASSSYGGNWRRNRWSVPAGAAWGTQSHDGWYWRPVAGGHSGSGDIEYVSLTDYTG